MGDFRFKISGNTSPFYIELSAGTVYVCSSTFEYSGACTPTLDADHTCAILSSLSDNTQYNLNITDCAGRSISGSFVTPTSPAPPVGVSKTLSLVGTTCDINDCLQVIYPPRTLSINQPLSAVESLMVTLSLSAATSTCGNAYVDLFKSCNGGDYARVCCISETSTSVSVCMRLNDNLCYDVLSCVCPVSGTALYTADASLELTAIGGLCNIDCGVIGAPNCLSTSRSCCVPDTTTTTTLPPIEISFYDIQTTVSSGVEEFKNAKICTSTPLAAGQSFRVCFNNEAFYCYSTSLICPITSCGLEFVGIIQCGASCLEASPAVSGPTSCTDNVTTFIDVTSDNIDDIRVCVSASSNLSNSVLSYTVYGCAQIFDVSNMIGGNFSYNPTSSILTGYVNNTI
jgi:hypothetical protein